jgi:CRISPR/Cas system-associated endonuclease Cas1
MFVAHRYSAFRPILSSPNYNARKATNPVNAILNYVYTALEAETRLAINAFGLDAGFGLLHADAATRDSLVYDLMEPVRPCVDEYVLDWIMSSPLKRTLFFEMPDGTCRLMAPFIVQLSESMMTWRNHGSYRRMVCRAVMLIDAGTRRCARAWNKAHSTKATRQNGSIRSGRCG